MLFTIRRRSQVFIPGARGKDLHPPSSCQRVVEGVVDYGALKSEARCAPSFFTFFGGVIVSKGHAALVHKSEGMLRSVQQ